MQQSWNDLRWESHEGGRSIAGMIGWGAETPLVATKSDSLLDMGWREHAQ